MYKHLPCLKTDVCVILTEYGGSISLKRLSLTRVLGLKFQSSEWLDLDVLGCLDYVLSMLTDHLHRCFLVRDTDFRWKIGRSGSCISRQEGIKTLTNRLSRVDSIRQPG